MVYFDFNKLVDVEYLEKGRNKENVVVIDARGAMLEEGSLMYDRAIVVDWTDISLLDEFGGENLGKLLSKKNYKEIFNKLNINSDTEVLVYGFTMPKQGFGDEGRLIYTFDYIGHDNIKIIDGGYDYIEKLGYNKKYIAEQSRLNVSELVREEAENNNQAIYTEELLSSLGKEDIQIIDTRLEVEYNGRVIYGENKAGHIPNAISIPFNTLVNAEGFIKSREEIEQLLTEKKIDKNKSIITYCTTGVRASYVAIILKELGYKVRNYEPSFARYVNIGEVEL